MVSAGNLLLSGQEVVRECNLHVKKEETVHTEGRLLASPCGGNRWMCMRQKSSCFSWYTVKEDHRLRLKYERTAEVRLHSVLWVLVRTWKFWAKCTQKPLGNSLLENPQMFWPLFHNVLWRNLVITIFMTNHHSLLLNFFCFVLNFKKYNKRLRLNPRKWVINSRISTALRKNLWGSSYFM